MTVRIDILSRREAESLKPDNLNPDKKYIMISVYGHDESPADIKINIPILRLQFDDIELSSDYEDQKLWERVERRCILFNKEHAKQIFDFVNREKPDHILVHCLAGVCRSAAIAAALNKIMYNEDDAIFKLKVPNMRVYNTMLEYYFCSTKLDNESFLAKLYIDSNKEKFRL